MPAAVVMKTGSASVAVHRASSSDRVGKGQGFGDEGRRDAQRHEETSRQRDLAGPGLPENPQQRRDARQGADPDQQVGGDSAEEGEAGGDEDRASGILEGRDPCLALDAQERGVATGSPDHAPIIFLTPTARRPLADAGIGRLH